MLPSFGKGVYDKFGLFNTDLRIAADYEILFRFLYKERVPTVHLPEILVRFRLGGMSNGSREPRTESEQGSTPFLAPERLRGTTAARDPETVEQGDAILPPRETSTIQAIGTVNCFPGGSFLHVLMLEFRSTRDSGTLTS